MKTRTRIEAEGGPFIIRRTRRDKVATYATKTGGWVTDREKAWKFDTRQQAQFILHGRGGEVVGVDEVDGMDSVDRKKVHELVLVKRTPAERAASLLSVREAEDLVECEKAVQRGLEASREARARLLEIRDRRLYRQSFATFEDYMEGRWNYSARQGHRLCDWAIVETNLLTEGNKNGHNQVELPAVESQARPLAKLPAAEQGEAWHEAVESAPAGKVTAKHVEAAVEKRLPESPRKGAEDTKEPREPWRDRELPVGADGRIPEPRKEAISGIVQDVMAGLGGLDQMLQEEGDGFYQRARNALVQCRPILLKYAHMDNMAAARYEEQEDHPKGFSPAAKKALQEAAAARWAARWAKAKAKGGRR
ncbi:MAG: hypothetical protein KGL39_45480 [Patescibacteria group bacterium]|nr:hypothetical protein [Patescibacteria group bacterium]